MSDDQPKIIPVELPEPSLDQLLVDHNTKAIELTIAALRRDLAFANARLRVAVDALGNIADMRPSKAQRYASDAIERHNKINRPA